MTGPTSASDYPPDASDAAHRLCLHLATVLGDLTELIVVVGGVVPSLIIDQSLVATRHIGTRDVDLGLALGVLDDNFYRAISERLRTHGLEPSQNSSGNLQRQTWHLPGHALTVDFLIQAVPGGAAPGRLQSLEKDFAAFVVPALAAAFVDPMAVALEGLTLDGARARRTMQVCNPAAFVVLKAQAFRRRGNAKDAYDLVYMLKHFGDGHPDLLAPSFAHIAHLPETQEALTFLMEDFQTPDSLGPVRAARFLSGQPNPELATEAFSYVQTLLDALQPWLPTATPG